MRILGVLKLSDFVGVCSDIDFSSYPFVDLTGRHSVVNNGVLQSSNKALFVNPTHDTNNHMVLTGSNNDFNLQRDFDVSLKFKINTLKVLQYIFSVGMLDLTQSDVSGMIKVAVLSGDMKVYTDFQQSPSPYLSLVSSSTISAGVEYLYKLQKRGNVYTVFIDGGVVAVGTNTNFAYKKIKERVVYLGRQSSNSIVGCFDGTIDDFKYQTF